MATNDTLQLSLLPSIEITPLSKQDIAKIAWSYTKRSTLEQCALRYYFEIYASKKNRALTDPDKDMITFLNQLENVYQRAGAILHLVIRTYFFKAQQGETWNSDRLISWAQSMFQKDRAFSRLNPDGKPRASEPYPPKLLQEYHYHREDADEMYTTVEERLLKALWSFCHDQQYIDIREFGCLSNSLVEKRFNISRDTYKIGGQIDLAYETDNGIHIIDWKLGFNDGKGNDSLQLAVYGLWAMDAFYSKSKALSVSKVHFGTNEIVPFKADPDTLSNARARIEQDVLRMKVLRSYGEQGIREAFTPCDQERVCRLCPFERVCYG